MDGLELRDGVAEGHALFRIFESGFERALRDAAGLGGDADAAAVECGERDFVAFAFAADAIGFGDFAIGEDEFAARGGVDAEFFFFLADLEAGRAFFDDECGDAFFAFGRIGVDVDDGCVGGAAVGDPGFGAVDDVFVALLDGFGLQRGGVGAGLRLGEGVAADFFSAREGDEEFLFLFDGAEAMNGIAVEGILNGENDAGGGAGAGDFFDDDGVGDVIEAGAAFGFGDGDSGEAEFGGFAEKFAREFSGLVVFAGEGFYFGLARIRERFSGGAVGLRLERDSLRFSGAYVEIFAKTSVSRVEVFGKHARFADDGHEIGIAEPARQNVKMDVADDSGAASAADVHADVHSVGFVVARGRRFRREARDASFR